MRLSEICNRTARTLGIDTRIVSKITQEFFVQVTSVLETEEPVTIDGFGEFYFVYKRKRLKPEHPIRMKVLRFRTIGYARNMFISKKVFALSQKIVSADTIELKKIGVKPEELPLLRREVNKLNLDSHLRLRRMDNDVTLEEIASQLSFGIEKESRK